MREDADKSDRGDEEGLQSCIEGRIRRISASLNFQRSAQASNKGVRNSDSENFRFQGVFKMQDSNSDFPSFKIQISTSLINKKWHISMEENP